MAVNGYAAAQDIVDINTGVSALAIAMGARVGTNENNIAGVANAAQAAGEVALTALNAANAKLDPATLASDAGAGLVGVLDPGTDAVPTTLSALLNNGYLDVLSYCTPSERVGVIARTGTTDLVPAINKAVAAAVATGRALYFRQGLWTVSKWTITDDITVLTAGVLTEFRQLAGSGINPVIQVRANVELWSNGAATISGNIATDEYEFNHGIHVYGRDGVVIDRFTCGDVLGVNLRGDTVCTEVRLSEGGYLGYCRMGTIYGSNIYRNVLSIVGGDYGLVDGAIVLSGGVGYYALDLEADTSTADLKKWSFGVVVGPRIGIIGDPDGGVLSGDVHIEHGYIDQLAFTSSTPAYPITYPPAVGRGVLYRDAKSISFGDLYVANTTWEAIADIGGESVGGDVTALFTVRHLELVNTGSVATQSIQVGKTENFVIQNITDVAKPSSATATVTCLYHASNVRIEGGKIDGKICNGSPGNITLLGVNFNTVDQAAIRNIVGRVTLIDCTGIGVYATQNSTILPVCINCTFTLNKVADNGLDNALMIGSSNNGTYYRCELEKIPAIQSGWSAMAGTASKGGFDTTTVTLPQLAQVVKGLLDANLAHDVLKP